MEYLCVAISYVLGSVPSGILVARFFKLGDPRQFGSGNIGASNLTRLGGKKVGALTLVFDFSKGFLPVLFARFYFPDSILIGSLIALAAVMGHCYSIFLNLRGGKGVATTAGVLLPLAPLATVIGLLVWLLVFYIEKITSLSALCAAASIPVILVFQGAPSSLLIVSILLSMIVFGRHEENLRALLAGTENSYKKS